MSSRPDASQIPEDSVAINRRRKRDKGRGMSNAAKAIRASRKKRGHDMRNALGVAKNARGPFGGTFLGGQQDIFKRPKKNMARSNAAKRRAPAKGSDIAKALGARLRAAKAMKRQQKSMNL